MRKLTGIELRRTPQGWWRYRIRGERYYHATEQRSPVGALTFALRAWRSRTEEGSR